MYNLVERVMKKLTKEEVNNFALSKNVELSSEELDFVYDFVKKNWEACFKNPTLLNLDRYKDRFREDNFNKIKKLLDEYMGKYGNLLK